MDTSNIKLRKLLNECRCCTSPDLDVSAISKLIDMREDFAANHQQTLSASLQKGSSPRAADLTAAKNLYNQADIVSAQFSGTVKFPAILSLFSIVNTIREELETILNAYYLAGYSAKGQFDIRSDFSWYTVPADYTIYEVALKFYGDKEAIKKILDANPSLSSESIALKTIKLPGVTLAKVDPAIYYGTDADDSIIYLNEDMAVLSPLESVVQSLTNTCKYGSAETPEFPDFGNPYIAAIGSAGATELAASSKLLDSIYLDPAVDKASIRDLSINGEALTASLDVKLIGSDNTISIKS